MMRSIAERSPALLRVASIALLLTASASLSSCGGGDDCAGLISVNASPEECESLAEQFGCSSFEVEGPTCGLLGCVSCGALNPQNTQAMRR